jgi:plasmid stability protein
MSYARLNIPLSDMELQALRAAAQKDLRHPKDQARYLLRRALLGEQPPDPPAATIPGMTNGAAQVSQTRGAALTTP